MKKKFLFSILATMFMLHANAQNACNATFTKTITGGSPTTGYTYALVATPTVPSSTKIYSWSFGNGTSGYGQQVSVAYSTSSTYTVCLTVMDSTNTGGSCTYTICDTINTTGVTPPPPPSCSASYYIMPDSANATPHNYLGFNTSTGSNLSYTWTWGDGTSSTGANPSHTYAAAGNYTVCLIVSNSTCVDTFCASQGILKTLGAPYTITFGHALSVNSVSKANELEVYPNPANDKIFIKTDASSSWNVEIYNLMGAKVVSKNINSNEAISTNNLNAGTYFIHATTTDGKQYHGKFSVTK